MRIENVVILSNEKSIIEFNSNNDTIKNSKGYHYGEVLNWKHSKNPLKHGLFYLGKLLNAIADVFLGIDSDYPFCCIIAYITNRRYRINEIKRILCYKCYKKIMRDKKKIE